MTQLWVELVLLTRYQLVFIDRSSTFSDQARDHGLPGVSPGIPPLRTCAVMLFHSWQPGRSSDKEKLELACKITKSQKKR